MLHIDETTLSRAIGDGQWVGLVLCRTETIIRAAQLNVKGFRTREQALRVQYPWV